MNELLTIINGDALASLKGLADESVNCVVTSPPYWKQRDYGHPDQLGQERTIDLYVESLTGAFREARRVLRADGTLWLVIDDKYADKQLLGLPWRVALSMQADGWILRCDNIWNKTAGRTETATDRPTRTHEYVFLFSKSPQYFYDAAAIREESAPSSIARAKYNATARPSPKNLRGAATGVFCGPRSMAKAYGQGRNKRSVWDVAAQGHGEDHFAGFPESLIRPCILAGTPPGGTVLDPFAGRGTTGKVALELGRRAILIELNPEYVPLIERRCTTTLGLPLEMTA